MPSDSQALPRDLIVGVDGGGSSTRAITIDSHGRLIGQASADGSNPNNIGFEAAAQAILSAVAKTGATPEHCLSLCLGVAGLADDQKVAQLRQTLIDQAPALTGAKIYLTHDLEIAHRVTFSGKPGVLLIAGTGSSCYALTFAGDVFRESGRANGRDDPGSGYSIGKLSVEEGLVPPPTKATRPNVAALAQQVVEDAEFGGYQALELLRNEAAALADLASPILTKFPDDRPIPFALHGGMIESDTLYRELFLAEAKERFPNLEIVESPGRPVLGALQIAWQDAISKPFPTLKLELSENLEPRV